MFLNPQDIFCRLDDSLELVPVFHQKFGTNVGRNDEVFGRTSFGRIVGAGGMVGAFVFINVFREAALSYGLVFLGQGSTSGVVTNPQADLPYFSAPITFLITPPRLEDGSNPSRRLVRWTVAS